MSRSKQDSFDKIILIQITLKWYLLTSVFSKVENKEVDNGFPIKKTIKSHQWRNESKCMEWNLI